MSIEDKLNYIKELKEEIETNKRVEAFFRTKGIIKSYEVFNPQTRKYEEEEDCECGRNIHKGLVKGQMRCKYCDIDGDNYNGGLTSDEEGV